jgi:cytoskeletal protein CcmA (bactofilin family)
MTILNMKTNRSSTVWPLGLLACVLVLASWSTTAASIFKHDSTVVVSNIESIDDDFYVYASRLIIEGPVNGDVSAFCYKTQIKGEISQTGNFFGQSVKHLGKIDGSFRAFASDCTVDGYIGRSALIVANDIEIERNAVIERDANLFGGQIAMDGTIKGNATIKGARVEITGVVVGNLNITSDNITIAPPAVITGNLTYTSPNIARIELDKGVSITGTTTWNLPKKDEDKDKSNQPLASFIIRISGLLASLIFGLVVAKVFRPYAEEAFNQLRTRLATALAAGLLGILILAVCIIILLVSLASLLAGYLLISNGPAPVGSIVMIFSILMIPVTSFAAVTGTIVLYSGKILCGFVVGSLIMSRAKPGSPPLGKAALFLGLVILALVFAIPYLGWVFYIAACVVGAGAIILGIKYCRRGTFGAPPSSLPHSGDPVDPQGQA